MGVPAIDHLPPRRLLPFVEPPAATSWSDPSSTFHCLGTDHIKGHFAGNKRTPRLHTPPSFRTSTRKHAMHLFPTLISLTLRLYHLSLPQAQATPLPASPETFAQSSSTARHPARHIPLSMNHASQSQRRNDPELLKRWAKRQADRLQQRYGRRRRVALDAHGQDPLEQREMKASLVESDYAADSRRAVKRQHGQEDLYNLFSDTEYYASIDVGTPARPYYVILDTGSADLWLASSECTEDQGCEATLPQYGTVASSTRRPFDASADQGGLGAVSRNSVTLNSTSTGDRTAISRPVAGSLENPGSFAVSYGSGRANGQLISDVATRVSPRARPSHSGRISREEHHSRPPATPSRWDSLSLGSFTTLPRPTRLSREAR